MSLTSHLAGHTNHKNAQSKGPEIALHSRIDCTPDTWSFSIIMLIDGVRREEPKDADGNEGEPQNLEAAQLTQLVLLQGNLIVDKSGQNSTKIRAEVHLERCVELGELTIRYKRILLGSINGVVHVEDPN